MCFLLYTLLCGRKALLHVEGFKIFLDVSFLQLSLRVLDVDWRNCEIIWLIKENNSTYFYKSVSNNDGDSGESFFQKNTHLIQCHISNKNGLSHFLHIIDGTGRFQVRYFQPMYWTKWTISLACSIPWHKSTWFPFMRLSISNPLFMKHQ